MTALSGVDTSAGLDELPVGRYVWQDRDGNHVEEITDVPIGGVGVSLRDAAGTEVAATVTDADGNYRFDDLPAGDYTVVFIAVRPAAHLHVAVSPEPAFARTPIQTWTPVTSATRPERAQLVKLAGSLG